MNDRPHGPLGILNTHWTVELLKTGYMEFKSPFGIVGLAIVEDNVVHLLSVNATMPNTGQFTRFMKACQAYFAEIYVWQIGNRAFGQLLAQKYRFVETHHKKYGKGLKWIKEAS